MDKSLVEALELLPEPLRPETFAPYGQLLARPERAAETEKVWLSYWHGLADIGVYEHPVWGFLEVRNRDFVLEELERHCGSPEVFIPAYGRSLMAFATGGDADDPLANPDPATIRVFLLEPGTALIVEKGTWHTPGFALDEEAGYLLLLEECTPTQDLDIRPVGPFRVARTEL